MLESIFGTRKKKKIVNLFLCLDDEQEHSDTAYVFSIH
jgi:hypothetical protein